MAAIRTSIQIPQCEHNRYRMQRALSWLERSEKADVTSEKFIFLWIAFNAAYGAEVSEILENQLTENLKIRKFLREILKRDVHNKIEQILFEKHSGAVRVLLGNQFVFKLFWRWARDPSRAYNWRRGFESNGHRIRSAMEEKNVQAICREVFRRLYELRNQVFHGGVNFTEGWVQTQIRDGTRIIADIVPVVLEIMKADIEANPDSEVWGKLAYPSVSENEYRKH
ncbi:MAG: HEPN domain-containing protein [Nitrospinae bacterium]|nr:HEPN domain-containing protein [Nitrospinota bacterium]